MSSLSKSYSFYRAPLSSINSNAQQDYSSSYCDLKKSGYVRRLSSATSVSSSTTTLSQNNIDPSIRRGSLSLSQQSCTANNSCESTAPQDFQYNPPFFKFHPSQVFDIFRKREQPPVDAPALERASAIHDVQNFPQVKVSVSSTIRQQQRLRRQEQTFTLEIYDEDAVHEVTDLVSTDFEATLLMNGSKRLIGHERGGEFLEPPNEEIFSEEMEELLTIRLSAPVYESDSEADLSEEDELSIATSAE